ncbi:DNA polymerase IV [Stakelama marina]|uniref:DNA polymerase IV n=1 Tax=Stakelama marina TaxID=2826939 RepID=A0A8T4IEL9_9SPHN|nr:DNA polymerase IV [Stakelama marina]MBR0553087.1 DNA polymerase IV [Stakelama marina]
MADDAPPVRKIIHVDMDAFFASVEQRDNPDLRGKPVAVGGSSRRGVVAAASYEARKFGVKSAMPSVTAARRCPDLIFVKSRFDVYRQVSQQIRAIFADYTDLIEPLSLDEAYLDVTVDRHGLGSAKAIAEAIRARIKEETQLTASAGVSYNKFIAKLASDQNKPDGLCVIPPAKGASFVASLPIRRFHGVGPVTAAKMERLGIHSGADLAAKPLSFLQAHFRSSADYLYGAARGEDHRPVRVDRPRKSVGAERTFGDDLRDRTALHDALGRVADAAWERVARSEAKGRTVTLKVRLADFTTLTRAQTFSREVAGRDEFLEAGKQMLEEFLPTEKGIRLLGLTLSKIQREDEGGEEDAVQPSLPL